MLAFASLHVQVGRARKPQTIAIDGVDVRLRDVEGIHFHLATLRQMRGEQAADGATSHDQNFLHASIHRSDAGLTVDTRASLCE